MILIINKFFFNRKNFNKLKIELIRPFFLTSLFRQNISSPKELLKDILGMSLQELCSRYPARVKNLFRNLNLNHEELKGVKDLFVDNDLHGACKALITYYKNIEVASRLYEITFEHNEGRSFNSESILNDTFTFQLLTKKVPRDSKNFLYWSFDSTEHDREWTWFLNRHYHLLDLLVGYRSTGKTAYVECISQHIIEWVLGNPSRNSFSSWGQWRGLEVAYRIICWSICFYSLQDVKEFSETSRILMLSSIVDHAFYLRYLHSWGANWLTREMNGLATIAFGWPEFRSSHYWFNYAFTQLVQESRLQVYPDGTHKELTSLYHRVTLRDFQCFADRIEKRGISVPQIFKDRLEAMWAYLAYSMHPDGYSALNNDSDQDDNRHIVSQAAKSYQRGDWTYIASNGEMGQKPQGLPSCFFPWAGQMIMRNGWNSEAHWAFFDIGPAGVSYHIHNDKLHLSIAAYGRDLLVDSGRYRYIKDQFWQYFRDSASHNLIMIDGKSQKTGIRELRKPIDHNCYAIEQEFDFALGTFSEGFIGLNGNATHSRAVLYLRDQYWVVVDRITTSQPRKIEALWHFHPECTVGMDQQSVGSIDPDQGNLKVIPAGNSCWNVRIVRGQDNPIQGWWSREYNHKVPNSTAIYSTNIETSTIFAWVLIPAKGQVPKVTITLLSLTSSSILLNIEIPDQVGVKIAVCMEDSNRLELSENLTLEGKCAILRSGQNPLVGIGRIVDSTGKVVSEHTK